MHCKSGVVGLTFLILGQAAMANDDTIRVIVKYKEPVSTLTALQTQLSKSTHLAIQALTPMAGGAYVVSFSIRGAQQSKNGVSTLDSVLQDLRKNEHVAYAVEDRVGRIQPLPTLKIEDLADKLLSHDTQWDEFAAPGGIMLESAPYRHDGAWAHTTGKSAKPIVIAVLDTGVALNDSLVNNLVKDKQDNVWGWNFAANNRDISDETASYHGTHVAGTIAGYGDVMLGVGEDLKILPVKIPDGSGMFYESQVINAIYWSVGGEVPGVPNNPYPAKVLNMSFGVDERPGKEIDHCDEALQEALFYAREQGAVIAVAAGNDNRWEHYNAPAVCNGTIKVASTGPAGLRAYYSNYGPTVSFAAPGGDLRYGRKGGILSTVNPGGGYLNSGFDFYQGTSMASPHVAGVAGLIFAVRDGRISPESVEQILYATTHAFGKTADENKSCVGKKPCGHGILDAENAIKATMADYDLIISAPRITQLPKEPCRQKGAQSVITVEQAGQEVRWITSKTFCGGDVIVKPVQLTTKTGQIIADYGVMSYRLDDTRFKRCEIIGFDGIGCYL
ncbi:AprE, Subtilisin-like serine protease [Legionella lansingensis]|uniref:Serine metalloprotease n=1 Tax=Legionella lansingensis TaxID=45067 RepID=A0A0W0VU76_9GAMM|nr:S8 family serine peptidase [Legionella lansingensis]KTD23751.1 serine metalloprotease [Legionella lansingensis]SNV47502.1 AprE, Subtilisin-like serine protease [Legionella lansingensis]